MPTLYQIQFPRIFFLSTDGQPFHISLNFETCHRTFNGVTKLSATKFIILQVLKKFTQNFDMIHIL